MTWIVDRAAERTYDPAAGLELYFVSGGSDGSQSLEIRGEGSCLSFTASLTDEPITEAEREILGISEAVVWRVYGKYGPEQRSIIVAALFATKIGHGFSPRDLPYFIRFESKGELYGG